MNAVEAITQPDHFRWEALRICDERDLGPECVDRIAHSLRLQAFQEAIRPYQKIRADVYLYKNPKRFRLASGALMEPIYEWTDEEKKLFSQVDEVIAYIASRYGLTLQEGAE